MCGCRVQVQDTNENAPVFDRPNYIGNINEGEAAGTLVNLVNPVRALLLYII